MFICDVQQTRLLEGGHQRCVLIWPQESLKNDNGKEKPELCEINRIWAVEIII